jgi:hypothetical protein
MFFKWDGLKACFAFLLLTAQATIWAQQDSPQNLPSVKVLDVRRAFHNGEHNAFTDLWRFGDHIYMCFRSCPDGHMVHPSASIIVVRSRDGKEWQQVHRFQVPRRDTRDPHFLVFRGKLFVYTGTWYSGDKTIPQTEYELNDHLGFAVQTVDGVSWDGPFMMEGTFGHYVWRAAAHGDRAYLCGRRKPGFEIGPRGEPPNIESVMLESDDGLIWRKRALFQETLGDETAFLFESDGAVVAVGRHGTGKEAQLLDAAPPYNNWSRQNLNFSVGGPLIVKWGEQYLVGGRKTTLDRGPKTTLWWLTGNRLQECAELPSAGDNSYPGFVQLDKDRALISYYSSHENDAAGNPITAIYLAEIQRVD